MAFSFNNEYSSHVSDEISLFLRQLLHRSSSSSLPHSGELNVGFSSSSTAPPDALGVLDGHLPVRSVMTISDSDRRVVDRASAAAETCGYPNAGLPTYWSEIPAAVCSNLTSSSAAPVDSDSHTAGSVPLRSTENDADDFDCESEEGVEEAQPKQNQLRNSSKRSRAAEVHNLSEKRRRSRINEKMKALQNLIPNSNKTDKASMLDEAIEYLKQLQLQVQMLSMRNGLILHPMCLPGFPGVLDPVQMSEMGLNFSNRDGSTLPSGSPHPCDPSTKPHLDSLPGTVIEEAPFSLQSSMANQPGSFHLLTSAQNICREDTMAQHQLSIKNSQANALESLAPMSGSVSKFNSQSSYLKDDAQGVLLTNSTSHIQLISSNLDGLCPGGTTAPDEV